MNKSFYILLAVLFNLCISAFSQEVVETGYYENHKKLGGEVIIKKSIKKVEGAKALTSFEVEAVRYGKYYISFWLCPTRLSDGSFAVYDIAVNGKTLDERISPSFGDWQCFSCGLAIELNEGMNIVSVIGNIPDVPSVEHVRMASTKEGALIDSREYDTFKSNIIKESMANADKNAEISVIQASDTISMDKDLLTRSSLSSDENPLYNYSFLIGVDFQYTFYKIVYFSQNQQVFLATTGIDNFNHVLELFSSSSPENYSWSTMCNSNYMASLNLTIPHSGLYYVRVRSLSNGRSGLCNLNVNGENYYENIPLYSRGLRCTQDNSSVYNTFTCYSTSDPRLWIEEGENVPGIITEFNDDYSTLGDYNWGNNSRVKKQYPRPVHAALLSAFASYSPVGTCDLYIKCQNSDIMPSFPNLKSDDAIRSSPGTLMYNCIAWSGGITSHREWPPSIASSFYSSDDLTAFDNFYAQRGLTREGATESNSVVDLWAYVDSDGNREYSHASLRKSADGNAHGYDWESKPGSLMRTFHPRYSLGGDDGYGEVVEHYIRIAESTILEEEIANGTTRIEYIDFDTHERETISRKTSAIDQRLLSQFNKLYNRWKAVTETTPYSNPKKIADCQEYREVLDFCKSNAGVVYAIYDKLGNGDDVSATQLIEDITLEEHLSLMEKVRNEVSSGEGKDGVKTIRPIHSNYVAYVKELISLENHDTVKNGKKPFELTGISYSNFAEYETISSADGITVNFTLDKPTNVSLNVMELNGVFVCSTASDKLLESGTHSYTITLERNRQYLVQLILDGRVNVRKIMVK